MPPRAKGRAPPRSQGKGKGKGKGAKNQQSLKFDDDEVDDIDGDNQGPLVSLDLQSSDDSDASEASGASDDESGESDSDNDNKTKAGKAAPDDEDEGDSEGSDEDDVSDEDDEEDDESSDDDRDDTIDTAWGRSASAYHGGDTADLEIGQDEEEAREEAAIARKMQKQRRAKETEDDFLILGDTEADAATAAIGASSAGSSKRGKASKGSGAKEEAIALRDLNDMGESERLAALRAEAPELEGLLAQLEEALGEASLLGLALSEAHGLQASRVTSEGLSYLELRYHLLLSFAMNANFYLLLRAEGGKTDPRQHPVVDRLLALQRALQRFAGHVEASGKHAVDKLVQTAYEEAVSGDENDDDEGSEGSEEEDEEEKEEVNEESDGEEESEEEDDDEGGAADGMSDSDEEAAAPAAKDPRAEKRANALAKQKANEQKLSQRAKRTLETVAATSTSSSSASSTSKAAQRALRASQLQQAALGADAGDDDDAHHHLINSSSSSSSGLRKGAEKVSKAAANAAVMAKSAAQLNTLTQKQRTAAKRASEVSGDADAPLPQAPAAKKRSQVGMLEVDEEGRSHFGGGEDHDDDDDDLGSGDDDDDGEDDGFGGDGDSDGDEKGEDFFKLDKEDRKKAARAKKLAAVQAEGNNDDDEEWAAFYGDVAGAADARAKKRKAKYTPEQRLAGAHTSQELAPGQKRAATYQIIKNRGLVAHKAKINRNPRVKKKEQFRKATIARKGQVRDIRDAGEGAHYGGESTGIRNNLTRSRKIEN